MFNVLAVLGLASAAAPTDATPSLPIDTCCPSCQSPSIRSEGPLEVDRYQAARYTQCDNCRHEWIDVFEPLAYPA